jgi:hypothetical protein
MASPNTLQLRKNRILVDQYLKGFYIHMHKPGVKGTPYKRPRTA